MRTTLLSLAVLITATIIIGCNNGESSKPAAATSVPKDGIPPALFATTVPENAQNIKDARESARKGAEIVLVGRVGGSKDAFVDGRAIFTLVDTRLKSCKDGSEMDWCKTPWDYCCEPRDELTANMASIEVLGTDGKPLRASLQGVGGLQPLSVVTVSGRVVDIAGGNLVVDAKSIHVGG